MSLLCIFLRISHSLLFPRSIPHSPPEGERMPKLGKQHLPSALKRVIYNPAPRENNMFPFVYKGPPTRHLFCASVVSSPGNRIKPFLKESQTDSCFQEMALVLSQYKGKKSSLFVFHYIRKFFFVFFVHAFNIK